MDATVGCVSRLPNLRSSLDVAFCSIANLHRLGSPVIEKVGSVGLEGAGAGKRRRLQASGNKKGHRSSTSSCDSSTDSSSSSGSSSGSAEGGGGVTREADPPCEPQAAALPEAVQPAPAPAAQTDPQAAPAGACPAPPAPARRPGRPAARTRSGQWVFAAPAGMDTLG